MINLRYFAGDAHNADEESMITFDRNKLAYFYGRMGRREYRRMGYEDEGASMFHAMKAHLGKRSRGLSIGSISFWLESIALFLGASEITIAEYQPIAVSITNVHWHHPAFVARNWRMFGELDWVREDGIFGAFYLSFPLYKPHSNNKWGATGELGCGHFSSLGGLR